MITDAQLRKAAEKSSDLYLRYVEQDYNSTPPHEFSASFEKKIRKLRKRADHPWIIDLKLFNQILNGILDKFKYAQINRTRPILIPCK